MNQKQPSHVKQVDKYLVENRNNSSATGHQVPPQSKYRSEPAKFNTFAQQHNSSAMNTEWHDSSVFSILNNTEKDIQDIITRFKNYCETLKRTTYIS